MSESTKTGDWSQVLRIMETMGRDANGAARKAVLQEGHFFRAKMIEGLTSQAPGNSPFDPLSPWTIAGRRLKGFSGKKALLRSGFLRNSISVIQLGSQVFTGVARTARRPDGKPMVDLARLHEFGAGPFIVQITPKMRRYLAVLAKFLKQARGRDDRGRFLSGTGQNRRRLIGRDEATGRFKRIAQSVRPRGRKYLVIRIPPRPFIRPIWYQHGDPSQMEARLVERMAKLLKGKLAR